MAKKVFPTAIRTLTEMLRVTTINFENPVYE